MPAISGKSGSPESAPGVASRNCGYCRPGEPSSACAESKTHLDEAPQLLLFRPVRSRRHRALQNCALLQHHLFSGPTDRKRFHCSYQDLRSLERGGTDRTCHGPCLANPVDTLERIRLAR
jgi:hypothetical protein